MLAIDVERAMDGAGDFSAIPACDIICLKQSENNAGESMRNIDSSPPSFLENWSNVGTTCIPYTGDADAASVCIMSIISEFVTGSMWRSTLQSLKKVLMLVTQSSLESHISTYINDISNSMANV